MVWVDSGIWTSRLKYKAVLDRIQILQNITYDEIYAIGPLSAFSQYIYLWAKESPFGFDLITCMTVWCSYFKSLKTINIFLFYRIFHLTQDIWCFIPIAEWCLLCLDSALAHINLEDLGLRLSHRHGLSIFILPYYVPFTCSILFTLHTPASSAMI